MQYRTGTVYVTNGSATVLVSSATAGAGMITIGHLFKTDRDGDAVYIISSRTPSTGDSITSITLSAPYEGATATGLSYQIVSDFTVNRGYPRPSQGDADSADWISRALDKIDADMGAIIGTASPQALETGGVLYKSTVGLATSASQLYWNAVSSRLGIGREPLWKLHLGLNEDVDGVMLTSLSGGTPTYGMYDGTATTTMESTNGVPCIRTDAATFTLYDNGSPRMRLDSGRLVIGNGSAGAANSGDVVIANSRAYRSLNAAGDAARELISLNNQNQVVLGGQGEFVKFGAATVALGDGAVATLGLVGGAGPSSSAQQSWQPFVNATGQVCFIPVYI